MQKKIRIFVMLLAIIFLFSSCKKEKMTCEELLSAGLEYGINGYSESGYIFLKNADRSSVFFMSEKNKSVMYGEKFNDTLNSTKDFAIYVSASSPYEIAVFECYSRNDTDEILRMCYERVDEIKIALRFGEWEMSSKAIELQVYKKYVIFAFTESQERNEGVIEEIKMLLS